MRDNIKYISAGAGSGKTYRLTEIIADLVEKGVRMNSVILTTFTKAAAADFRERTREKLLNRAAAIPKEDVRHDRLMMAAAELDSALIGTVHSVALQYIKKYWYELGISANIVEMDEDAKKDYVRSTLPESAEEKDIFAFREYAETLGLGRKAYGNWIGDLSGIIEKADGMNIEDLDLSERKSLELASLVLGTDGCKLISDEASQYPAYRKATEDYIRRVFKIARRWRKDFKQYKLDHGLVEFNDMETMFIDLLENKKDVQDEISQSISYLFVDEFQDSNPKQIRIFDLLSNLVKDTVYWVGDKKQSIYRFRGCDPTLVKAISSNDNVTILDPLDHNWRSEERIVRSANEVFRQVFSSSMRPAEITLEPSRGQDLPEGVNSLWHWDLQKVINPATGKEIGNAGMLMNAIAGQIREMIDGKHEIRHVLDKDDNMKARPVRPGDIAILAKSNDYDIAPLVSSLEAWGIPVIKDDAIDSGNNEVLLVQLLLNYFLYHDSSLLKAELAKQMYDRTVEEALSMNPEEFDSMLDKLEGIREELSAMSVSDIVRGVIIRLGLMEKCAKWGCAEARRNHLAAVIKSASDYENTCLSSGLSATLNGYIATLSGGIKVSGFGEGGVTVTTYHRSKGLEWNVVILYNLQSDPLDISTMLGRFVCGVNVLRDTPPTADNPYSKYHITFVPSFTGSKIKDSMSCGQAVMATPEWRDYYEQEAEEAKRRLYVGFTRARDYLITTSLPKNKKGTDLVWFKQCEFDAVIGAGWADGSLQTLWSDKYPVNFRKICDTTPIAPAVADTYCFDEPAEAFNKDGKAARKRVSPSSMSDEELVKNTTTVCLNDDGHPFPQIITRGSGAKDDEVGTCIHNIFAAYDPEAPRTEMVRMAADTIARHGLSDALTSPEAVISSIETLCDFLVKSYGKAVRIEHELPFRELRDGQMTVGSIDLVWYTSSDECVLVDFKNLPGAGRNVLDPSDRRFLGHYAPQQKAYRDALTLDGKVVRASLIYLSMQGKVIGLNN